MRTFKAKKPKSKYKNTESWIEAVYRHNKAVIDSELSRSSGNPKRVFKQIINEYMQEGLSPTKAMQTLARSTIFTTDRERIRNNMWAGLKGDKEAYKIFRELTKENGRYTKFDESKLVWDRSQHAYIYSGVMISFQNSPFGVSVRRV